MTVYEPGSGSANQGTTFECLNLASVWRLPVIFVFENNGYAASTAASFSVASGGIAKRPAGKAAGSAWVWHLGDAPDAIDRLLDLRMPENSGRLLRNGDLYANSVGDCEPDGLSRVHSNRDHGHYEGK